MPEAHRAITRAAHEHVAWRRRHVQQVGASDLLTVTYFLDKCLPTAELFQAQMARPSRHAALVGVLAGTYDEFRGEAQTR